MVYLAKTMDTGPTSRFLSDSVGSPIPLGRLPFRRAILTSPHGTQLSKYQSAFLDIYVQSMRKLGRPSILSMLDAKDYRGRQF